MISNSTETVMIQRSTKKIPHHRHDKNAHPECKVFRLNSKQDYTVCRQCTFITKERNEGNKR